MKRMISLCLCLCIMLTLYAPVQGSAGTVKTYSKATQGEIALSTNFKVREFACNDGSDMILIDSELVVILQNIRDHFGQPITITSGYRTESYNKKVGGASGSYHTKGMAADIVVSGVSPSEVAKYAETIGVRGIGRYDSANGNFVHVDTRPTKYYWSNNGNSAMSTFGGNYNSKPYSGVVVTPPQTDTQGKPHISNTGIVIRYGESGNHVSELQACLNYLDNAGLKVDGKFGDATHTAVKNFQAKHGLSVDGDAGPITLSKINELINGTHVCFIEILGKNHESAHAHRVYETCTCGKTRYTGATKKVDSCEECYPTHNHEYTVKYESAHPHKQYKICDCGEKEYTGETRTVSSCDECHNHSYLLRFEDAHPHEQYKICDCGDKVYTGKTRTEDGCEECHEHDYTYLYEDAHPHKQYKLCDCGEKIYTGKSKQMDSCVTCFPKAEPRVIKLQIGVPNMTVDGMQAEIDPGRGTVPFTQNGRTLMPIRAVVEAFGASVLWDETTQKVSIFAGDTTIYLWIGSYEAIVNGQSYTMDVAPMVVNGRTFMPLRFIAESLGLTVGWNDLNQTVTVEGTL